MILSAHQPAYLPWLGYFNRIARADIFVFLDAVQFEKNSFINRNRIRSPQGPCWLTVPVKMKGHTTTTIKDVLIDNSQPWRNKHLRAIEMNYNRSANFSTLYPKIRNLFEKDHAFIWELCWDQLQLWLEELGITTRIAMLSELPISSRKSALVLDLCKHFGADTYLSGALGRNYLDEKAFRLAGVSVSYQSYSCPPYPQQGKGFEPGLSILDYLMNCSPTPNIIMEGDRDVI